MFIQALPAQIFTSLWQTEDNSHGYTPQPITMYFIISLLFFKSNLLSQLLLFNNVCRAGLTDYCTKTQFYSLILVTLDHILWRKYFLDSPGCSLAALPELLVIYEVSE